MPIQTGPGSPQAFSSASGGKVYAYNNITSANNTTVAPANPSRQKIVFHNPGDTDIFISPALAFSSVNAPSPTALTPTTGAPGGSWVVFANGGTLEITGECQGAWQALAKASNTKPLTVMDSNL